MDLSSKRVRRVKGGPRIPPLTASVCYFLRGINRVNVSIKVMISF